MILNRADITDNFIVMIRGFIELVKKNIVFFAIFIINICTPCNAAETIGIITDTLLTPVNYYNAYFKTPEFFATDIRGHLLKKGVKVVAIDDTREKLKKIGLRQYDLEALQGMQQGYNLDYKFLKKIGKCIGVKKIIIVTMGMDVQRDFLKNTMWNIFNVSGMDVVNPTHRVSVYTALVDINNENVIWESIYAKNIRNNKMKNLDTTISNNYEGMLRLKEYSKYISHDIAYNVKMKLANPNFVEAPTYITRENIKEYVKDRHNIGVKKELSEIDRQKWDTEKLKEDTKENIKTTAHNTKEGIQKAGRKTGKCIKTVGNKTKKGFIKLKNTLLEQNETELNEQEENKSDHESL